MIKLERLTKPKELTEEKQKSLTETFKRDKNKRVWDKLYIKRRLLEESNHKCAYCECLIGNGYKEMHVDHFHYKDKYPDEVVKWDNLNPSCPHCNECKSSHDTYEEPIINPFEQDPKDYFYIKNYRYYSRNQSVDKIVNTTIEVLGLNDSDKVVFLRYKQGDGIIDKINDIYGLAISNMDILMSDVKKRNRVKFGCRNILKFGLKDAEFATFMATTIENEDKYIELRSLLNDLGLWDDELQKLDKEVMENTMHTSRDNN